MRLADIRIGHRYVLAHGPSAALARGEQWLHTLESMGTVDVEAVVTTPSGRRLQVTVVSPEMFVTRDKRLAHVGARTTVGPQQLLMSAEEYTQMHAAQQAALAHWRAERLPGALIRAERIARYAEQELQRTVLPVVPSRPQSPVAMDDVGLLAKHTHHADRRALLYRLPAIMQAHGYPYSATVTREVATVAQLDHDEYTRHIAELLEIPALTFRTADLVLPARYVAALDRIDAALHADQPRAH